MTVLATDSVVDTSGNTITILLQGVLHKEVDLGIILQSYTTYCPVVLSIYDTDYEVVHAIAKDYSNVTIVQNKLEEFIKDQKARKKHYPSAYHNHSY